MRTTKIIFVLGLLTALGSAFKYDYYTFTMEVPGATCMEKDCQTAMEGNLSDKTFNMHGLWPSATDGNHPFDCQPNIYNEDNIKPDLLARMNANWVGLYNSTYWFRYHEYGKHGSCFNYNGEYSGFLQLTADDQVAQMNAFFTKALDLKDSLDLKDILFAGSMEMGAYKFSHDGLMKAVSTKIDVKDFLIECVYNSQKKMQALQSIEVCYNLQFEAVDCSSVRNTSRYPYKSSCQDNEDIYVVPLDSAN